MERQSLFGTDGIRGRVGQSPLTPHELMHFGNVLGAWMERRKSNPHILIGYDTRHSAALVSTTLKAGMLQHPVTLFDGRVIPTPAVFHQVVRGSYDFGIMITASHNAYPDNGIKVFTKTTGKLSPGDEKELTDLYYQEAGTISYDHLGTECQVPDVSEKYVTALSALFPSHFLSGITLVIDCGNGAYSSLAPAVLSAFGAHVITLSANPDGKNINKDCGSLHPALLQETVLKTKAHAGFAFDGDGDRLLAVARDGSCKDGDELLAFLLQHPAYQNETSVVGTVMSNQGFARYLTDQRKTLERTPVGDKHVIEKMKARGALLGGEPSGHLILRDFTDTADGLFALLRIAQTAQESTDWNLRSFKKFPHVLLNVPVACKKDLTHPPFATIIAHQQAHVPEGRIVVRYSGTEPLLRIMVEAETSDQAVTISALLSEELTHALTKE